MSDYQESSQHRSLKGLSESLAALWSLLLLLQHSCTHLSLQSAAGYFPRHWHWPTASAAAENKEGAGTGLEQSRFSGSKLSWKHV